MAKRKIENGSMNREEYETLERKSGDDEVPHGMVLASNEILKKRRIWKKSKSSKQITDGIIETNDIMLNPKSASLSSPSSSSSSSSLAGSKSNNPFANISFASLKFEKPKPTEFHNHVSTPTTSTPPPPHNWSLQNVNLNQLDKVDRLDRLLSVIGNATEHFSQHPLHLAMVNVVNITTYMNWNWNYLKVPIEEEGEEKIKHDKEQGQGQEQEQEQTRDDEEEGKQQDDPHHVIKKAGILDTHGSRASPLVCT